MRSSGGQGLKGLVGTAALCVLALMIGTPLLTARVDASARDYERAVAGSGWDQTVGFMRNRTEAAAVYDPVLIHTDGAFDQDWVQENLTTTLDSDVGSHIVLVVDAADALVFAREKAAVIPTPRFEAIRQAVAPAVARLRTLEPAGAALRLHPRPDRLPSALTVSTATAIEGRTYMVQASMITSSTGTTPQRHARAPILLIVSSIDRFLLPEITARFRLRDAALAASPPPGGRTWLMIPDVAGRPVTYLTWSPRAPGLSILSLIGPPGLLVVLALLSGMLFAYRRSNRATLELQASQARAHHLAFHDQLTELANRRLMIERLTQFIASNQRHGGGVAVFLIDLDRFKLVNDTYGHSAGDGLIREVARRLKAAARTEDVCARLGGDEFVVLAANCGPAEASTLADRIVASLAQAVTLPEGVVHTAASIGISVHREGPGDPDDLLRQADLALYRVKESGRGHYCFFELEMDQALQSRRGLESDLRAALKRGDIDVAYQPQFKDDRITGVEALARWTHPDRGPIAPSYFIPLAEECGLISDLGLHVVRRVFEDAWRWPRLRIAINLSAVQLRAPDFLPSLQMMIDEMRIAPEQFEFEITEGVLMADDIQTQHTLAALNNLGFSLALDDFGTGYSGLGYLRKFPVSKIKIDRSFVTGLPDDRVSEAVVRAMVRLGRTLGMEVIAEGVETQEQRSHLAAAGCRSIQGFLLGRPGPAEDIDGLAALANPYEKDQLQA